MSKRTIEVDYLARVEGEGSMHVCIEGGVVTDVALKIFEPPRLFEALLRGRHFTEAPDVTARICGICPVAYQMSAVHALEAACGVTVGGPLRELRRLLYCGEWIESHVLHVYMLHAPDYLGYPSAIHMAKDHPEIVKRGLRLKRIGNQIMTAVGGREIHPINVKVGGFYRAPTAAELGTLLPELRWARDAAEQTCRWAASLPIPQCTRPYQLVALCHEGEYAMNEGRLKSSAGLNIPVEAFEAHFEELHVARSNALHALLDGQPYLVGPLARWALSHDVLPPSIQALGEELGVPVPCLNPFQSIVVRSLEVLYAVEEALRIVELWAPPPLSCLPVTPRSATGHAVTEAPRGILYHRYDLGDDGLLRAARIVPPTSQNQRSIEDDLRALVEANLGLEDDALRHRCEQTIRAYDPCISCATHFLDLTVERR